MTNSIRVWAARGAVSCLLLTMPHVAVAQRSDKVAAGIKSLPIQLSGKPDPTMTGQRQMSALTKGMVIGGGVGLGVSTVLVLVAGEYYGTGADLGVGIPVILGSTAIGALVGAAIGSRFEAPPRPRNP